MKGRIIRTDGSEDTVDLGPSSQAFRTIADLIGATHIETVNIWKSPENCRAFGSMQRPVMCIDEDGYDVEVVEHGPGKAVVGGVER
ncbi:MAG: hypothetical protein ACRECQ_17170, partial [Burkholderiaceae bacterium]